MMFFLPKSQSEMARWLSVAVLGLLVTCYLGILFAPNLSIHLATDLQEPLLAGDWRGVFGHKNVAAAVMVMMLFLGIYIASSGFWTAGLASVAMALVFLVNAGGKSALALGVFTFVLSSLTAVIRSFWLRAIVLLSPLVLLNMLSVGTVMSARLDEIEAIEAGELDDMLAEAQASDDERRKEVTRDLVEQRKMQRELMSDRLAAIAESMPFDTSFTGRTEIWIFALQSLRPRLVLGYGFAAFWGTGASRSTPEGMEWAATVAHSHNGYLDTALAMGLPGLVLLIAVLVIMPLRDFHVADRGGNNGPLTLAFLRLWLFGIYLAAFESFFLDRADPIWFTFLIAVFGLHYLARFRAPV